MNEVRIGTIYPAMPPIDQQVSGAPPLVSNPQFLAPGTAYITRGPEVPSPFEWSPPSINDAISRVVWVTARTFAEVQKRERRWNAALAGMRDSMQTLTNEISSLKSEIQRLERSRAYVVPLTTLTADNFRMTQQIPVTIEGDGEDFTASFVEANISASGETEADAIANFKESLLSSYEVLEGLTPNQLAPLPARQWGILQNVVRRTD